MLPENLKMSNGILQKVSIREEMAAADPRDAVMDVLVAEAASDETIVLLDADVSKSTRSRNFGKLFPDRFFNVGIAEMHMASMAAGLACSGMKPVISSFAVFLALRALEPIRTQIAYDNLHVIIMGGYTGFTAMQHGPTHQCICDIAIMRAIPNVAILSPSDAVSAADLFKAALRMKGPVYMRIGYNIQRLIYKIDTVRPFDVYMLHEGRDVLILSTGLVSANALEAVSILQKDRIDAALVDIPTLDPFPEDILINLVRRYELVFTVEEHGRRGGLFEALSSAMISAGIGHTVISCSTGLDFGESAPYDILLQGAHLDPNGIATTVRKGLVCGS
jgi:transketolase